MTGTNSIPEFKDRRTGLIIVGVLVIIMGGFILLLIPLILLSQLMVGQMHVAGAEAVPLQHLLPGLLVYLVLAVAFIWLGIGSIMCRRWARALMQLLSWIWLIVGILSVGVSAYIMPQVLAQTQTSAAAELSLVTRGIIMAISMAVNSVIFVLIPGALAFFYGRPNVKATCEHRHPNLSWTDTCPLPVLALSVFLAFGAAYMPIVMWCCNGVVPWFGTYLHGFPGQIVLSIITLADAFAAYACYKKRISGWYTALGIILFYMVSGLITFAQAGLLPMYELMEFSQTQIDRMKHLSFVNKGPELIILMLLCGLPYLGFLVYTKRFFKQSA